MTLRKTLLLFVKSSSHTGAARRQKFHGFVTGLKKLSFKCEFDNLQDSLVRIYVTPEKGLFKNATSLCPKQLVQVMLLRKHKACMWKSQILTNADVSKFVKKELNKSSHNSHSQNTKNYKNI